MVQCNYLNHSPIGQITKRFSAAVRKEGFVWHIRSQVCLGESSGLWETRVLTKQLKKAQARRDYGGRIETGAEGIEEDKPDRRAHMRIYLAGIGIQPPPIHS